MSKTLKQLLMAVSIAAVGAAFAPSAFAGPAEDAIADAKEAEKLARKAEAQGMLGYMQATAQSSIEDLHI